MAAGETPDLLRQLALARFRAGDREGGAAASRRVLRHEPACIRSMHNLALAALQRNQLRLAAGWIRRGMQVNRHDDGLRRLRMRLWMSTVRDRMRRATGAVRRVLMRAQPALIHAIRESRRRHVRGR